MAVCASCGLQLVGEASLCSHHHSVYGDDWSRSNRVYCDFFHRGVVPARLTTEERCEDFWATPASPEG